MIIPKYWAEARLQHRERRRSITVRRFGWSDDSQAAADAHAQARAQEAMADLQAGQSLLRRERRVAYNGGDGVPIREEVVLRDADSVITRNGYGALCLNTPDVLFADIDFDQPPGYKLTAIATVAMIVIGIDAVHTVLPERWLPAVVIGTLVGLLLGQALAMMLRAVWTALRGGPERMARARVAACARSRPGARLRVYRTPLGLRVLALHARFDPRAADTLALFHALRADARYVRMCRNQNCFRARVSPKPWRMGMPRLHPPYGAAWRPEHAELPMRQEWIDTYTRTAAGYAACRYLETLGDGPTDPQAEAVRVLHDSLCQAESGLPIA